MRRLKWPLVCGAGVLASCCLLAGPCGVRTTDNEPWVGSAANIVAVGRAIQGYHDRHGRLPPAVVADRDGRVLYGWRVLLLPYLECELEFEGFRLDEPWDSPHNAPYARSTPRCYRPAFFGSRDDPGLTRFQVLVGPGTAFERPGLSWADVPDGLANTLLVVEGGEPVVWSKPADVPYDPAGPLPPLGGVYTKPAKLLGFSVGRDEGFNACFADGTSRFVRWSVGEPVIRGLITRNGGELVEAARLE